MFLKVGLPCQCSLKYLLFQILLLLFPLLLQALIHLLEFKLLQFPETFTLLLCSCWRYLALYLFRFLFSFFNVFLLFPYLNLVIFVWLHLLVVLFHLLIVFRHRPLICSLLNWFFNFLCSLLFSYNRKFCLHCSHSLKSLFLSLLFLFLLLSFFLLTGFDCSIAFGQYVFPFVKF